MAEKRFDVRLMAKGSLALLVVMTLLLALAGRVDYWQLWLFGAINVCFLAAMAVVFSGSADLFRERFRASAEAKGWDRVLWIFFGPANLAIVITAGLDAGRFGWSAGYPPLIYALGYLGYVCGGALHLWSIRQNPFYTSTVSIQEDGGQSVIDRGPYRLVRHPGYSGIILMVNSMAVVLGSPWALIPSGCSTLVLILRTWLEDRALRNELSGYGDYAARIRYRLLPGVW
jgi:protein-S-isoprenylcysteine O-methyltransferase Ste14